MTTGSRVRNGTYVVNYGQGQTSEGPYWSKSWSGGDSISQKKVVPSRPTRDPFPRRPDMENRLPNESSKAFRARVRRLRRQWLAAVRAYLLKYPKTDRSKKGKPRKRVMPPNGYTATVYDYHLGNYQVRKAGESQFNYCMNCNPLVNGHVPLDPKDHYRLIEKLRRKVYGSGFHPGIFAAESGKALGMIFSASTQIRNGLLSLAKGNWRGIVRNLGEPTGALYGRARYSYLSFHEGRMSLSKAWLAFQYGWRPLVDDLEDGTAYIAEQLYGNGAALGRRVVARRQFAGPNYMAWDPPGLLQFGMAGRVTTHDVQYVITNLRADTPSAVPPLASAAAVAWEVLPYSFVCDWVAPIGGYLQALRTASQIKGSVVLSIKSRTEWYGPRLGQGLVAYRQVSVLPTRRTFLTFTRTVSDEISPPTPLGDLSPGSIFSVWERAANAVALLQKLRIDGLDPLGFKKLTGRR